jgi:hypothetical protein
VERDKTAKPQTIQIFKLRWWGLGRGRKNKKVEEERNKEEPSIFFTVRVFSLLVFVARTEIRFYPFLKSIT